jgi:probable F420-dependent oxidoreductase
MTRAERRPGEDRIMNTRDFRFGVVVGQARSGGEWTGTACRAESLGFDTLLVPDTRRTPAPFPALAAAAAATTTLRVGTYVLSAPNRTPGLVAWESTTLDVLSDGRFELGVGGGRPGADADAEAVGADFGTPADRLARVVATIEAVREARAGTPTEHAPILVAASRPRMLRVAAAHADIVALGLPPHAQPEEQAEMAAAARAAAGSREIELHMNVAAVAETVDAIPEWASRMVGGDPRAMAAAGGIGFLLGTPEQIADALVRRRESTGISYIAVGGPFMDAFAPVIPLLRT